MGDIASQMFRDLCALGNFRTKSFCFSFREEDSLIQCVFNTPPPPFVNIMLGFEDLEEQKGTMSVIQPSTDASCSHL